MLCGPTNSPCCSWEWFPHSFCSKVFAMSALDLEARSQSLLFPLMADVWSRILDLLGNCLSIYLYWFVTQEKFREIIRSAVNSNSLGQPWAHKCKLGLLTGSPRSFATNYWTSQHCLLVSQEVSDSQAMREISLRRIDRSFMSSKDHQLGICFCR